MYLSFLNSDLKKDFIELAFTLVSADGVISEKENSMLKEYCSEMNISPQQDTVPRPLNILLDSISSGSDAKERKIIIFELMGIAIADSNYDGTEKKIIELARIYFNLDNDFLENCENVIREYYLIQNKINKLVIE